jgi:hypothetical protein
MVGAGQLPMLETGDVSGITWHNTHNPKLKTNDMNIPIYDIFQSFLWLFGILWPAIGAVLCLAGAFVLILFLCELWEVCTNFYYDGSDSYKDRYE